MQDPQDSMQPQPLIR